MFLSTVLLLNINLKTTHTTTTTSAITITAATVSGSATSTTATSAASSTTSTPSPSAKTSSSTTTMTQQILSSRHRQVVTSAVRHNFHRVTLCSIVMLWRTSFIARIVTNHFSTAVGFKDTWVCIRANNTSVRYVTNISAGSTWWRLTWQELTVDPPLLLTRLARLHRLTRPQRLTIGVRSNEGLIQNLKSTKLKLIENFDKYRNEFDSIIEIIFLK